MVISIVVTVILVAAQRHVVRKTGSLAISADRAHYVSDILVNAGVIVGLLLASNLGWQAADPLMGLAIAALIANTAWHVFIQSYDQLMDRELPDAAREEIKTILLSHPEIHALHDLRTRAAGTKSFIQVHIELDPALSLYRAHQISDEAEALLRKTYKDADILIHQDVAGLEQPAVLAQN
jgi:ferrous-iron efflux pump FieF